jgi:glutaminase
MTDPTTRHRIHQRLTELYERHLAADDGAVASYYDPAHGYSPSGTVGTERDTFGISLEDLDGELYGVGDHATPFAVQSISKVFVYALALADCGRDRVLAQVGVEPSGDAFNSILLDEDDRRPYNPMVNAGAIVAAGMVHGADSAERIDRIVGVMRRFAGNDSLSVDQETFEREWQATDRNRAIAYLMRSNGMLTSDVDETLAVYLQQCSVKVTCDDLARMAATLANGGVNPVTGVRPLPGLRVRDVLSVMFTCGMYDYAGEWAFEVGVPAKSAVSGGILAAVPGKMGIGTFSPGLDPHGNSVRGVGVCREVSQRLGLHLFAGDDEDAMLGPSAPAPPVPG